MSKAACFSAPKMEFHHQQQQTSVESALAVLASQPHTLRGPTPRNPSLPPAQKPWQNHFTHANPPPGSQAPQSSATLPRSRCVPASRTPARRPPHLSALNIPSTLGPTDPVAEHERIRMAGTSSLARTGRHFTLHPGSAHFCVTLGTLLNLQGPRLVTVKVRITPAASCCEDSMKSHGKHLTGHLARNGNAT